jgi:hypothetical protein
VRHAAAGRQRQDCLPLERELRQQVEPRLEQPGVGGLVHRGRDHDAVGADEPVLGLRDPRVGAVTGLQGLGRQVEHAQVLDVVTGQREVCGDVVQQLGRAGVLPR